ncbi:hypothetical protein [Winogradskyella sp.]|uniref:hypothetical protein n=1 Tax=Winogradskyella sp. TaxID=1883156 RepID=UPI00262FF35A|nr:hypothetical protein [Winogradskyella sp.]
MRKIISVFICLLLFSCGTKKVTLEQLNSANKNFSVRLKNALLTSNVLGGHKSKFGKNKKEAITMYHLRLRIIIDGMSEYSLVDFNDFSLLEHQNKIRHRPEYVTFGDAFNSYSIQKIKLEEFKGEDKFFKYSQAGYKDDDHLKLESNAISALTDNSYQYRFKVGLLQKRFIKKKAFTIHFYTRIEKEGEFSLYYKDKLVKKFIGKKSITKFE